MTTEIGGFDIIEGTAGDDQYLAATGRAIVFGLGGNDAFANNVQTGESYFVGGPGSDAYLAAPDTFTIIHETGNSPNDAYFDILLPELPGTAAALIDGRHLLLQAIDPNGVVLFVDWELEANRIEFFNVGIPTPEGPVLEELTFEQFRESVYGSPAFVGTVSFDDLDLAPERVADLRFAIEAVAGGTLPGGLTAEEARTVALLYEAGLGRPAEKAGLNFWIDVREGGLSETGLAEEFLKSEEFLTTVGDPAALTDRELVEALYLNVLERPGDAEGVDFWTEVAERPGFGDAELLLAFAVSPENAAAAEGLDTLAEILPGVWDFA